MTKVAIVLLSSVMAVPASTPISAGRWEISNQMEEARFNDRRDEIPVPLFKPKLVCLSEADAVRGPGLAFSDGSTCRVLKSSMAGGVFEFETECKATESGNTIMTKAAGSYTTDAYEGTSTSIQHRDGTKIEMRSRMRAKLVGQC